MVTFSMNYGIGPDAVPLEITYTKTPRRWDYAFIIDMPKGPPKACGGSAGTLSRVMEKSVLDAIERLS